MQPPLETALYLLPFLLLWWCYGRVKLVTNCSEIAVALTCAIIAALPFLWAWWEYGRSGNPFDSASWIFGVPAIAWAPVAALFGALFGVWALRDIRRLFDSYSTK